MQDPSRVNSRSPGGILGDPVLDQNEPAFRSGRGHPLPRRRLGCRLTVCLLIMGFQPPATPEGTAGTPEWIRLPTEVKGASEL